MIKNNNILVTGSSGQLGQEINSLIKNEIKDRSGFNFYFLNKKDLNITDKKSIKNFVQDKKIRLIINCAAFTNVELAEDQNEVCYEVNSQGVKNLVDALNDNNGSIIHISTDYVFDGNSNKPYKENDSTKPLNVYGLSKLEGEKIIRSSNISYAIVRTSWLYSKFGNNFFKSTINKINSGEDLNIVCDQIGSPTNAHDLAFYVLNICDIFLESNKKYQEILHFANSGSVSWFEFANEIKDLHTSNKIIVNRIKTNDLKLKANRPKFSALDNKKAENFVSYNIKDWKDSLSECHKSYLNLKK
tara:strand:- start:1834 stop:2736 length:903 start_codon:yes stop_codon:yes gene_type:complete